MFTGQVGEREGGTKSNKDRGFFIYIVSDETWSIFLTSREVLNHDDDDGDNRLEKPFN